MRRWLRWPVRVLGGAIAILVIAAGAQRALEVRDEARFPAPGRRIDVGGRRLHLLCEGSGSPTVLLEAGGTHFSLQYAGVVERLAARTRTCAYDRAGMGWSDPSPRPLDVEALTGDLERLASGLAPPFVIAAGSAGGLTAELFARRHPTRVAGLVLLDALSSEMIGRLPGTEQELRSRARWGALLVRFGVLRWLDPLGRAGEGPASFALTYRARSMDAIESLVRAWPRSADQLRAAPPLRSDLPLVVVARGRRVDRPAVERAWRAAQTRMAARSSRGRLVVARGSGHHVVDDRPDIVLASLEELVEAARR